MHANEIKEIINNALDQKVLANKLAVEHPEFFESTAKVDKAFLDSLMAQGFKREEAVTLVAAHIAANK